MAKFCTSCGSQLADEANNCTNCGAPVRQPAPAQEIPVINQQANPQPTTAAAPAPQGNPNTSKYIGMGAVAVLAIIIIALIANLFSGSYKEPIKDFFKGLEKQDADRIIDAMPEDIFDSSIGFLYDDAEEYIENVLFAFIDDDIKISYDIKDKEKLDDDDIEELEDNLKESTGSKATIKKAYEVELEVTMKLNGEKDETKMTLTVANIKGQGWKLIDAGSFL